MTKRGRTDGHLSKEEYEQVEDRSSFSQPADFAVSYFIFLNFFNLV